MKASHRFEFNSDPNHFAIDLDFLNERIGGSPDRLLFNYYLANTLKKPKSTIYIFAVTDLQHDDNQFFFQNTVEDPVPTNSDTEDVFVAGEFS